MAAKLVKSLKGSETRPLLDYIDICLWHRQRDAVLWSFLFFKIGALMSFFQVKPGRSEPSGTGWTHWGSTLVSTTSTCKKHSSSLATETVSHFLPLKTCSRVSHKQSGWWWYGAGPPVKWTSCLFQRHRWRPGDLPVVREDQGAGGLGQSQQASLL